MFAAYFFQIMKTGCKIAKIVLNIKRKIQIIKMINKNYWDYRLMAKEYKGEIYFDIHSVYYQNDLPIACSLHPASVGGSSVDEAMKDLTLMQECFRKPVIWYGDRFPEEYKKYPDGVLNKILSEIRQYEKEHPIRWWFYCLWVDLYCGVTNNKLMKWLDYKIKRKQLKQ
jgi:hypothetical protein